MSLLFSLRTKSHLLSPSKNPGLTDANIQFPDYVSYNVPHSSGFSGSLLLIRSSVPSRHLTSLSSVSFSTSSQINFLEIYPSTSPSSFIFCSLYCHPQATSKDYDLMSSSL